MGTPSIHVIRKIEEISSPGACRWDHRRASWGEGSIAADGAGYARVRREKGEARGGRKMAKFSRVIWIVLDSVGIGPLPDAAEYGDAGRNTLGHIALSRPLVLPNLVRLGLANIEPLAHLTPPQAPVGYFGKGATRSPGKDTTTGHWEMAGIWLD